MAKDWTAEQLKHGSPTMQAEDNLAQQRHKAIAFRLETDIATLDGVLDLLNTVQLGSRDDDLIAAIRSLGAYRALLSRQLLLEANS